VTEGAAGRRPGGGHAKAIPIVVRAMSATHAFTYRLSGGRLGGSFGKAPVLLLKTTGRKSGKTRETPLMHIKDGDTYTLMASNGGRDTHPAWYWNLLTDPNASIRLGAVEQAVRAEPASPEQASQLWPKFVGMYKSYEGYRKKSARQIPIVLLRPR